MRRLAPVEARERLHGTGEIAFLDLREAGAFGEGHPLFAIPAPYSRLEAIAGDLVPRRDAPVLLIDGGDGVSERAARRLASMGYSDIALIEGGVGGWAAAGFALYQGVNVPSKTLGELVEAVWHPQTVSAETLAAWRDEGRRFAFFDARPPAEHSKMRVPGARCLPNGELAHRLAVAAPEDSVPLVVTCAGRTRGIVGAIGLGLAGRGGPVYALENGTQGWALAGHALERGARAEPYPALDAAGLARSRERAAGLMGRFGIPQVAGSAVAGLLEEEGRTSYLFDVRSEEEAAADPIPGAVNAPGGQLVQATDAWVGVRRARLILVDDTGLRAALAAFWLRQLGYDAVVAPVDDDLRGLAPRRRPDVPERADEVAAGAVLGLLREGRVRLLDLRGSMAYRAGHVAGATWGIRPNLAALAADLEGRDVVLVADDPAVAHLAAVDLEELGVGRVTLVEGGQGALEAAGAEPERSPDRPSDAEAVDYLFFVHDRHDGNLEASRRYLAWETGLVAQLDEAERREFRVVEGDRAG